MVSESPVPSAFEQPSIRRRRTGSSTGGSPSDRARARAPSASIAQRRADDAQPRRPSASGGDGGRPSGNSSGSSDRRRGTGSHRFQTNELEPGGELPDEQRAGLRVAERVAVAVGQRRRATTTTREQPRASRRSARCPGGARARKYARCRHSRAPTSTRRSAARGRSTAERDHDDHREHERDVAPEQRDPQSGDAAILSAGVCGGKVRSLAADLRPRGVRKPLRCASVLEISLLGPPRIRRDGEPVSFDTRKATALLAHLALAERARSREALCELLWPDQDPEHARGALRRTLSAVRKAVGEEWMDTTGDSVALRPGASLDVADVPGADRRGRAGGRGRRLPRRAARGLLPAGQPELRRVAAARGGRAAARARRGAGPAGALAERGGRVREGDPLRAALARARPAARAGAPRADPALRARRRPRGGAGAVPRLRAHAAARSSACGPVDETAALFEQVSEGTLSRRSPRLRSAAAPAPVVAPPDELPLVGRAAELALLASARTRARCIDGRVVVIEGEAGIGKSRLARELLADRRRRRALGALPRGRGRAAVRADRRAAGRGVARRRRRRRAAAAARRRVAARARARAARTSRRRWR